MVVPVGSAHLFKASRYASVITTGMALYLSKSICTVASVILAILICAAPKWPIGRAEANNILPSWV